MIETKERIPDSSEAEYWLNPDTFVWQGYVWRLKGSEVVKVGREQPNTKKG